MLVRWALALGVFFLSRWVGGLVRYSPLCTRSARYLRIESCPHASRGEVGASPVWSVVMGDRWVPDSEDYTRVV